MDKEIDTELSKTKRALFDLIPEDVLAEQGKSMWMKRSITKGLETIYQNTKIIITPCDSSGFSVTVYPKYPDENKNISLHIGFNGDGVYIQDLCGNGEGSDYQNKGYGTLLVNVALQVIRYMIEGDVLVTGTLSDVGDKEDPEACQLRRNHFWSSFGFHLKKPDDAYTPMKAYLSELKHIDRGLINGYLPTALSLQVFYRYFNRPAIPYEIVKVISNIDVGQFSVEDVPSIDTVFEHRDTGVTWAGSSSISFLSLLLVICAVNLYPLVELDEFVAILAMGVVGFGLLYFQLKRFLLGYMPGYKSYERLLQKRRSQLDQLQKNIIKVENEHGGLIWRAYDSLSKAHHELRSELFDKMSSCSKSQYFDQIDIEQYGKLISNFKAYLRKNKTFDSFNQIEDDFLFGNMKNGMSLTVLTGVCNYLENDKVVSHINRLLRQSANKILVVTSGSSRAEGFSGIIKALKNDIAFVEFYTDSEPYVDMSHLQVKLYLSEGVLDFKPNWTAWKEGRAEELVRAVSAFFENDLINKTFISQDETGRGYYEKLFVPKDAEECLMEIFDLINHRWMDKKTIEDYSQMLKKA